jgi:regulator of PEP synthase PpsR (kinase-PPPase family)
MQRRVFFISDRTGITAETLGETLLTQFQEIEFTRTDIPFVTSPEKARMAVAQIEAAEKADGTAPLVFSTLTDPESQSIIATGTKHVFDLFGTYIEPLERALGVDSSHSAGRMHGMSNTDVYQHRVDALNFTLDHDDGLRPKDLELADVVLVGVSRSGKTPTSLYLAMHFHLKAANYPLNDEDLEYGSLPETLEPVRDRIFGLSIKPEQLSRIRHGRRPNSRYSSMEQCVSEVHRAEAMYRDVDIPFVDTTSVSIEEIATNILQHFEFERPHH